ncbi:alanine:cation symporter family protein [Adlercreutzia sp. DFI.6.23]|nr:alanine:cation symporter family protein [Adlercreutzia sp. DFI.6.23]
MSTLAGAIFWMWIIALLGMATNYAEAVMAQKTRVVDEDGTVVKWQWLIRMSRRVSIIRRCSSTQAAFG